MNGRSARNMLALLLSFLMLVMTMTGCTTTTAPTTAPTVAPTTAPASASATAPTTQEATDAPALEPAWKKDTSPITLTWYCNYSWQITGDAWNKTKVGQFIASKTGVSLDIIAPAGNETEKLNTMIASNSLPDLVTADTTEPLLKKAVDAGQIYALNDLADQHDPYFYSVIDKDVFAWYKYPDGKTYGYGGWAFGADTLAKYPGKMEGTTSFLVRKDIYEAIGSPDMRTPDGFLSALKAAQEKYPEVNGQSLMPLGFAEFTADKGCWSIWAGTFLTSLLSEYLAQPKAIDGKITDRLTDPEFVTWLKTFRKANEMGLVSKQVFIDKDAQIRENVAQGRYFALMYRRSDMMANNTALFQKDPSMAYIAIDPPANSKKDKPRIAVGGFAGWVITMISKNCKNPERAIQYMTYRLSDEGQLDAYLGKQGETWDVIDGKEQFLPDVYKLLIDDKDTFISTIGGEYGGYQLSNRVLTKKWESPLMEPNKQPYDWTLDKVVCEPEFDDMNPMPSSDEGIVDTMVSNKWAEVLPKLILAKTDAEFDTLFNQFLASRKELGFDKLMAYWQAKYEANMAKMGAN